TALPATMPTPIPGPMAARPYPTTLILPVMPVASWASTWAAAVITANIASIVSFPFFPDRGSCELAPLPASVAELDRVGDVDSGQECEDVRLEHRDEDLEDVDAEAHHEPQHPRPALEDGDVTGEGGPDEDDAGGQEQAEHGVAGHQVGEKPDRQRE